MSTILTVFSTLKIDGQTCDAFEACRVAICGAKSHAVLKVNKTLVASQKPACQKPTVWIKFFHLHFLLSGWANRKVTKTLPAVPAAPALDLSSMADP